MINIDSLKCQDAKADFALKMSEIKKLNEEYKALVTICDSVDDLPKGSLYGVPFTVKDNILTKDLLTTACSKTLEDYCPY